MARCRLFLIAGSMVLALAVAMAPQARAQQQPPRLSGWWISIDDTFKSLWDSGTIVPMEELLIIDEHLRFENRMMGFWPVSQDACAQGYACSDAPLVASGRLVAGRLGADEMLTINDHRATTNVIDSPRRDGAIRSLTVSATRQWPIASFDAAAGILVLRKGTGHETRTFYRVEPNRLRRLRAGLMAAELPATRHWRCFIAVATGATPPDTPVRPSAALDPLTEAYLKAASYRQSALWQGTRPLAFDPDPQQRKLASVRIEDPMFEPFASLPLPKTQEERRETTALGYYLRALTSEVSPAMKAEAGRWKNFGERLSKEEFAALKLMLSDSPESRRLFCKS